MNKTECFFTVVNHQTFRCQVILRAKCEAVVNMSPSRTPTKSFFELVVVKKKDKRLL